MTRVEIKNKAKESLEGKRGTAALFLLVAGIIYFALNFVLNLTPFVGAIINIIISAVYSLAIILFIVKLTKSKENLSFKEGIPQSNIVWKYIVISFLISLITFLAFIPLTFSIFMAIISNSIFLLLSILIIIFFLVILLSIPSTFAGYILIDNPDISIGNAISKAFSISFKNFKKIFMMILSLIPWGLLTLVTLGLALFYVKPYVTSIYYIMYKDFDNNLDDDNTLNLEK